MKQKDLVYLVLAVVILLVAGYVGYSQLLPKKAAGPKTVQVEVVGAIPGSLDQSGLTTLNDPTKVKDFDSPEDLSGLGNPAPFGN